MWEMELGSVFGMPPNAVPMVSNFPGNRQKEMIVGMSNATSSKGIRGAIFGKKKITACPIKAVSILKRLTVWNSLMRSSIFSWKNSLFSRPVMLKKLPNCPVKMMTAIPVVKPIVTDRGTKWIRLLIPRKLIMTRKIPAKNPAISKSSYPNCRSIASRSRNLETRST